MKDKIRPYYSRLQGYLSQAPTLESSYTSMYAQPLCDSVNQTIDKISQISGNDYAVHRFEGADLDRDTSSPQIRVATVRGKLGALIAELHGTFYLDEPAPFSGMPSMVITQSSSQNQEQTANITLLLEIQSKIDEKTESVTDPTEKSFLEKVKANLSNVKNGVELLGMILKIGNDMGLTVEQIMRLLH